MSHDVSADLDDTNRNNLGFTSIVVSLFINVAFVLNPFEHALGLIS